MPLDGGPRTSNLQVAATEFCPKFLAELAGALLSARCQLLLVALNHRALRLAREPCLRPGPVHPSSPFLAFDMPRIIVGTRLHWLPPRACQPCGPCGYRGGHGLPALVSCRVRFWGRRLTEVLALLALLWLGDDVDCARSLRLFLLRAPHPEIPRRHDLLGSGSSG